MPDSTHQFIDPNRRYLLDPDGLSLLGMGKTTAYRKRKAGELKIFRDGHRSYIHGSEIIRYSRPPEE